MDEAEAAFIQHDLGPDCAVAPALTQDIFHPRPRAIIMDRDFGAEQIAGFPMNPDIAVELPARIAPRGSCKQQQQQQPA